ncbi:anti-sigma regulatory factor (Ser/Thr protein kinase) [Nocardiopsis mwathae]|uniref:Anti-sigma regulatory factor (Ser/Thr protein kinase) n=1 Tax=Nocardiopsis mwathae TaxID=1472723 RepID=A0A7W9YF36_9ACTN|nr:ATP-binding protein [Nocardiopsis mwathae]MBB6171009.1 anti-sigma regulatory factor (Ser/Thr protein kinase) [Nocardiopsis mwathae]
MTGQLTYVPPLSIKCGCFEGSASEVPNCRSWLRMILCDYPGDVLWVAELCVTELASNALAHTRSSWIGGVVWVRVEFYPSMVRVVVRDNGSEKTPTVKDTDSDALGGRGLALVRSLASGFGHRGNVLGREVWFDLEGTPET